MGFWPFGPGATRCARCVYSSGQRLRLEGCRPAAGSFCPWRRKERAARWWGVPWCCSFRFPVRLTKPRVAGEVPSTAAGEQRHQAVRKEGVTENIRMVDMIFHQREIRDSLSPSGPAVSGRSPGAAAQRRGYSKTETALMALPSGKITGFRRVRFPRLSAQPPDPS